MKKMNEESGKPKKRRKIPFPDTYVLIISLMALAVIMTYIIPAGSFERVMDTEAGQLIVQPGTYQTIEPVSYTHLFIKLCDLTVEGIFAFSVQSRHLDRTI